MRIEVAVCAFRRLSILDTLESIAGQDLPADATLRAIVAENDDAPELREQIERHAAALGLDLDYVHAPARNISVARNACLDHANGEVLLFVDDDEVADPGWIRHLIEVWRRSGAGVVFGPAFAVYPPTAPDWMRANNFHSNIPTQNGGVVETGFSSNVLLDRGDARIRQARFDPAFGRTGGEDVDFFFRLHRAGVLMAIADEAVVRERVSPTRMSFGWVFRRRHMTGAIYGACVSPDNAAKRMSVLVRGVAKAGYCGVRAIAAAASRERCSFWIMRGSFHAGVVSGCISPPRREVYGGAA